MNNFDRKRFSKNFVILLLFHRGRQYRKCQIIGKKCVTKFKEVHISFNSFPDQYFSFLFHQHVG